MEFQAGIMSLSGTARILYHGRDPACRVAIALRSAAAYDAAIVTAPIFEAVERLRVEALDSHLR